jgi:hypothetical protein
LQSAYFSPSGCSVATTRYDTLVPFLVLLFFNTLSEVQYEYG